MRRRHRTQGATARLLRWPGSLALAAVGVLTLLGCSDTGDDAGPTTTESTTTAPIPTPGGQAVEDLDVCTLIDEARMASYLDDIDAPAVVSTSSDATVVASVCSWFVEDRDEVERPDRVLLRVEPLQLDGNVVCDPPDFADSEELPLDDGDGWTTVAAPVEAASVVGDWCAYLAAPEGAEAELNATRTATVALLDEVQAALPR